MERFTLICNVSNIHKGIPEGKLYVWWQNGTKLFEEEKQQYSLTPGVVMSEEIFGCALNNEYNSSDIALETVTVEGKMFLFIPFKVLYCIDVILYNVDMRQQLSECGHYMNKFSYGEDMGSYFMH